MVFCGESFCFCWEPRTGVQFLSRLYVLFGAMSAVLISICVLTNAPTTLPLSSFAFGPVILFGVGVLGLRAIHERSADLASVFYAFNFLALVMKCVCLFSMVLFLIGTKDQITQGNVTDFVDKLAGTADDTNPDELYAPAKQVVAVLNKIAVLLCDIDSNAGPVHEDHTIMVSSDNECDSSVWKDASAGLINVDVMNFLYYVCACGLVVPAIFGVLFMFHLTCVSKAYTNLLRQPGSQ
eukprot:111686_1